MEDSEITGFIKAKDQNHPTKQQILLIHRYAGDYVLAIDVNTEVIYLFHNDEVDHIKIIFEWKQSNSTEK